MPMLSKPEDYDGDWDDETDYSWDNLARQQLALEDFGTTLEDGDVYALLHRNGLLQDWSRRCFALIDGENAYIFNELGVPVDDPSNFVTKGCQPLYGDHGFIEEFDGGNGEYYRKPQPAQDLREGGPQDLCEGGGDTGDTGGSQNGSEKTVLESPGFHSFFKLGARVRFAFGNGPVAWYGALVGSEVEMNDGLRGFELGFDDGDIKRVADADLERMWAAKTVCPLDIAEGGLVENVTGMPAAALFVKHKLDKIKTVGLFVGKTDGALLGQPIYHSFHIKPSVWPKSKSRSALSMQDRLGMHTFRRGDHVIYQHLEDGELPASVAVYGCSQTNESSERDQKDRYLILYEIESQVFFVGSWPSWRRAPMQSGMQDFDMDNDDHVRSMSLEQVAHMHQAWVNSSQLEHLHTRSKVQHATRAAPPTVKARREAANEKKRKGEAEQLRVQRAAERKKGRSRKDPKPPSLPPSLPPQPLPPSTPNATAAAAAANAASTSHVQPPLQLCSTPVPRVANPDTPPSLVCMKRQLAGLKRAQGVERSADREALIGELEFDIERREAKRRKYGL